jgi:hypothetical protein
MWLSQSLPFSLTLSQVSRKDSSVLFTTNEERQRKGKINHAAFDVQVRGGTTLAKTTLRRAPLELFILWQGTPSSVLYTY